MSSNSVEVREHPHILLTLDCQVKQEVNSCISVMHLNTLCATD